MELTKIAENMEELVDFYLYHSDLGGEIRGLDQNGYEIIIRNNLEYYFKDFLRFLMYIVNEESDVYETNDQISFNIAMNYGRQRDKIINAGLTMDILEELYYMY